jgi:hypothetical protein
MPYHTKENRVGRRDFLRWSARVGGSLLLAPILEACRRLGWRDTVESPTAPPSFTHEAPSTTAPVLTISPQASPTAAEGSARIALVRTRDRAQGTRRALALFGQNPVQGKAVLLKPNFNSADPAPASTHPDTLRALTTSLQEMGAGAITIADRSGMGGAGLR